MVISASRAWARLAAMSTPADQGPPFTLQGLPQELSLSGQPLRSAYGPGVALTGAGGAGSLTWTDPVHRSGPDDEIDLRARMADFTLSPQGVISLSGPIQDGKPSLWKTGATEGIEVATNHWSRLIASQSEVGANPAALELFRATRSTGSTFSYEPGDGGVWAGAAQAYDRSTNTFMTLFAIP